MGKKPSEVVSGELAANAGPDRPERAELGCEQVSGAKQQGEHGLDRLAEPSQGGGPYPRLTWS